MGEEMAEDKTEHYRTLYTGFVPNSSPSTSSNCNEIYFTGLAAILDMGQARCGSEKL